MSFSFESRFVCPVCGRTHDAFVKSVSTGRGALTSLPEHIRTLDGHRIFLLADVNTDIAAGDAVRRLLDEASISYAAYVFPAPPSPDEKAVGSAVLHYDPSCDLIVGIGSGVINDIGKILSRLTRSPYIIVGTAPSMDGYASASSSMVRDGVKFSVPSKCPDVIIGDTDILKTAPDRMLTAGLGDMLAKYTSLAEWRISALINGEYYCEKIASIVRDALKKCTDNAEKLLRREDDAVEAVFEGLVLSGAAMNYAGLSRPASGVEHYISHIWDMRTLSCGDPEDLHGIQCAVGSLIAARLYEQVKTIVPDREKALAYTSRFSLDEWHRTLKSFLGSAADTMIALEKKEGKYALDAHRERLEKLIAHWDKILTIIDEEIPSYAALAAIADAIRAPKTPEEIGLSSGALPTVFAATKDIRDKYVLSRLVWDLGVIDEMKF